MELPQSKTEILIWIIVVIIILLFGRKVLRKYFTKEQKDIAKETTSGTANKAVTMPADLFHMLLDYRNKIREYAFYLANFRIVHNDFSSMPELLDKKKELVAYEQTLSRFSNIDLAFEDYAILKKYKSQAENALRGFNEFTQKSLVKLQNLYGEYNPDTHSKDFFWLTNAGPVYREYLLEKLPYINKTFKEINTIDNYIEGIVVH